MAVSVHRDSYFHDGIPDSHVSCISRISSQKKHICVWRNASPLGGFLGDRGYLWNVLLESEIPDGDGNQVSGDSMVVFRGWSRRPG